MTYPLTTLAPTIDSTGISAPTYDQVLSSLKASYQGIFGADVYIEPDSQDGQFLAILAKAISDGNTAMIATYNSYSPATAQGAGLSSAVKMNGMARNTPTSSTADILVVGVSGTVITNGIVADVNGTHQWALPSTVTIPAAGQITVTATCQDQGAIQAQANTLTKIVTPTYGWQSANNAAEASAGAPVESDAALRRRQASSAALPAVSPVGAIIAGLASLTGVTAYAIHENYTDSADAQGVPAHSIATVITGGDVNAIASTIATKKAPGCGTYGSTSILTNDPNGMPITINFSRPIDIVANVVVNVSVNANFSSTVASEIQSSIQNYINSLDIGETLRFNRLWLPAQLVGNPDTMTYQVASMTLNGGVADITANYNQQVIAGTVTVNTV